MNLALAVLVKLKILHNSLIHNQINPPIFFENVADGRWQFIWGQGTMVEKMVKNSSYIYIY